MKYIHYKYLTKFFYMNICIIQSYNKINLISLLSYKNKLQSSIHYKLASFKFFKHFSFMLI
jgi:hypothetical protein